MARNIGLKIPFNSVWERIKKITGWDKDKELAEFLGVKPGTISGAKQRGSFPIQWAFKIGQEFNCNTDWLMTGNGPVWHRDQSEETIEETALVKADEESDNDGYVKVPRYEVAASAGGGGIVHSEQVIDYLSFRADWVRNALGVPVENLALISVIGDSMEPTLSDGDLVLLDLTINGIMDSAIYVIQVNDSLLVKRIQRKLDGSVIIKSDNQKYDSEMVSSDAAEQLKIIGRVIWAGRRM